MKKIALICTNLRGNLGDYAIIDATVQMLCKLYGSDIQVGIAYHGYTGIDIKRTKKFEDNLPYNTFLDHATPLYRPSFIIKVLRKLNFSNKNLSKFLFYYTRFALSFNKEFKKLITWSDITIIAGGGHYGGLLLASNMLAQIDYAVSTNKDVFSFPQTVPLDWFDFMDKKLITDVLEKLKIFTLRENNSFQYMKQLNLSNCYQIADIVFSIETKQKKLMHIENDIKKIGIVLADTGSRQGIGYVEKLYDKLLFIEECGYIPIVITTTESVDEKYLKHLKELYPQTEIIAPESWKELISTLGMLDLVITNRFHGIVFSTIANVPVLPVVDVPKAKHIAETMGIKNIIEHENDLDKETLLNAFMYSQDTLKQQQDYYRFAKQQLSDLENKLNTYIKVNNNED